MTVQELLKSTSIEDIIKSILSLNPDVDNIESYCRQAYETLISYPVGEDDGRCLRLDMSCGQWPSVVIEPIQSSDCMSTVLARQIGGSVMWEFVDEDDASAAILWELTGGGYSKSEIFDYVAFLSSTNNNRHRTICERRAVEWHFPTRWSNHHEPMNGPKRHRAERQFHRLRQLIHTANVERMLPYIKGHQIKGLDFKVLLGYGNTHYVLDIDIDAVNAEDLISQVINGQVRNDDTHTVIFISPSSSLKEEAEKIADYFNNFFTNPEIYYGINRLKGIAVKIIHLKQA